MVQAKSFSLRSAIAIATAMVILLLLLGAAHYFMLETLSAKVELVAQSGELLPEQLAMVDQFDRIRQIAGVYFVPATGLLLILIGLVLWRFVCRLFQTFSKENRPAPAASAEGPPASGALQPKGAATDERLFLHLLSVLQREGRLVDFLSEDLTPYEDSQIGAAIRAIHESCKKTVEKYIGLEPVVQQAEGASYQVAPGFDPATIKLTGNVAGTPPLEGVVRHKGWRADRLELPTLSGRRDDRIIAPAEIEIL